MTPTPVPTSDLRSSLGVDSTSFLSIVSVFFIWNPRETWFVIGEGRVRGSKNNELVTFLPMSKSLRIRSTDLVERFSFLFCYE